MDVAKFKAMVNYKGEKNVLAIYFNNGYRTVYCDKPFSFAENLDEGLGLIVDKRQTPIGVPYTMVRDIALVECITFVDDIKDLNKMDPRFFAG